MRKVMMVCVLVCCTSILVGCSPRQAQKPVPAAPKETWSYDSISNPVENKDFIVSITPALFYPGAKDYHSFKLSLTNKTNINIEIVWDKTLFITNGSTSGGFMFEGVVYRDRNNPKPNDVVFGNATFTRTILPNNLVEYAGSRVGWWHNEIKPGENGIYITVKIDGKEISEKVLVNIRKELNKADLK